MNLTLWLLLVLGIALTLGWRARRAAQRRFIDQYRFPSALRKKLQAKRPQLTDAEVDLVLTGLREFFHLCHRAGRKLVAMPSQVVDDAWHEFILFTRQYQQFCRRGLGRFLHHTPAEAMAAPTRAQEGIQRAWRLACAREGLNPRFSPTLPLLFAIDAQLNIADGFHYVPDCKQYAANTLPEHRRDGTVYCAGHIGCAAGCAGDSGAGDGDGFDLFGGDGGDSGCGGGCGGD